MASWWKVVVAALCVLHLCRAQVCNVTVEDDQTIYRVPPVTASRCDFSWSNATGSEHIVLAHQVGRSAVVRSYNISTLTTSGCFDWIMYRCKCQECTHYQLNCTTTCNAKRLPQKEKETGSLYIGTAIAVIGLLLLVVVVVGVLVKRRRICNYDPVKTDPESSLYGDQGEG